MSELSPDARDLIAQARRQGPRMLGPSAEQRAALHDKLAPLWAAEATPPRAAGSLRWRIGAVVILAGLGLGGWLYQESVSPRSTSQLQVASATQPPPVVADQRAAVASDAAPNTDAAQTVTPVPRDAAETCPPGSSLRGRECLDNAPPSSSAASGEQLTAATKRKAKRALPSTAETSGAPPVRKAAPQPQSAAATPEPPAAASAAQLQPAAERDLLAELGLDADARVAAERGQRAVQPARKAAAARLPLKAAEARPPERPVQKDADPKPPSIDGELELLSGAQTALQKQRPSRALTLLQEHAFRFPTGAMVEERMAMQALALCALQRRHAAKTVLSNLEARGSQSQLLPRVRNQCGL